MRPTRKSPGCVTPLTISRSSLSATHNRRGRIMHKHHGACSHGLTLGDIVSWSGGASGLGSEAKVRRVATVWHDSRKVEPGDVFVALATEKDDGHRFVRDAFARG